MKVKITDDKEINTVEMFIKDNPDIAEKYKIKKIKEYEDAVYELVDYEIECDTIKGLFSFMSKLRENAKNYFVPIMYDNYIDLFYGTLEDF
jgi:hypothetical protein